MKLEPLKYAGAAVLLAGAFAAGWGLNKPGPSPESVPAVVAPEVKQAPTVRVKTPPVKAYAGKAKVDLKLPAAVQAAPDTHVVAATQVPSSQRPQTITTTLDAQTGEFQTYVKTDPYPWFAIETRGEVRLAGGYKIDGSTVKPVLRLGVGYDVVRIKAFTAGVVGTVDSDGDAFLGVGVAYRF